MLNWNVNRTSNEHTADRCNHVDMIASVKPLRLSSTLSPSAIRTKVHRRSKISTQDEINYFDHQYLSWSHASVDRYSSDTCQRRMCRADCIRLSWPTRWGWRRECICSCTVPWWTLDGDNDEWIGEAEALMIECMHRQVGVQAMVIINRCLFSCWLEDQLITRRKVTSERRKEALSLLPIATLSLCSSIFECLEDVRLHVSFSSKQ